MDALSTCRALPNLLTFRPCDGNEMSETWLLMLQRRDWPSLIALSRQSIDSGLVSKYTKGGRVTKGVANGCYIVNEADEKKAAQAKPDVVVMASGSEVERVLFGAVRCYAEGVVPGVQGQGAAPRCVGHVGRCVEYVRMEQAGSQVDWWRLVGRRLDTGHVYCDGWRR